MAMQIRIPVLLAAPLLLAALPQAIAATNSTTLTRGGYLMAERHGPLPQRNWLQEAKPQLAACAALPAAPAAKAGQLRVIGLTKDRYFNKFFQGGGKLYRLVGQQQGVPMAIVLDSGQWRLAQLQAALAEHPGAIERQGASYLLRLPLLLQAGASLVVQKGETLRLSRDRGTFMINLGLLHLSEAKLQSWDEGKKAVASVAPEDTTSFQPFLLGWSGSTTVISKSQVSGLGFAENLTHGLAFAAGPVGLAGLELPPPPRVFINGSEINNLYSGVHATAVPELRICGNRFLQNRLNAVHLDIGSGGIVADNHITGTQGPYALYFNKNATNIWVLRNDISENKRSGMSVNDSADIVIAGNRIRQNFDAIFLQASERVLLADNEILDHQRHGVSLRDAGPIRFQNDRIGPNRGVGIMAKKAKIPDALAGTAAKFIPEVQLAKDAAASAKAEQAKKKPAGGGFVPFDMPEEEVVVVKSSLGVEPIKRDPADNRVEIHGVLLQGNHSSAMEVEAPYNIVFDQAEVMYPDVRRRPVFRGVLNDFESDILFRLPRKKTLEFAPLAPAKAKTKAKPAVAAPKAAGKARAVPVALPSPSREAVAPRHAVPRVAPAEPDSAPVRALPSAGVSKQEAQPSPQPQSQPGTEAISSPQAGALPQQEGEPPAQPAPAI
jgi:poly(beta-D-mannuronate) C5 epimerase